MILGYKKKSLSMLDHLLVAEQKGLIDDEGIKEEVDTFTFEVSIRTQSIVNQLVATGK